MHSIAGNSFYVSFSGEAADPVILNRWLYYSCRMMYRTMNGLRRNDDATCTSAGIIQNISPAISFFVYSSSINISTL